ncbi:MAG TPA: alanyl-tRNA editing protein [Bryobacteraceae bacterium]|nr:alanyl-tRNA editing protein [Bryobacteraceae bacterium]
MPTERLYYTDPFLRSFRGRVTEVAQNGSVVYLDRSAFYPSSGGQPADYGRIADLIVSDTVDEDDRVAHVLSEPSAELSPGSEVECEIDWPRRFGHMQQHSGQHLLSAVLADMFRWNTISFHMGSDLCTIDLDCPSASSDDLARAEGRVNEVIAQNIPVQISFEDAEEVQGLRKASTRSGRLRVITISGVDRSACGGTHVASTGQIGCVAILGQERIRQNLRLQFLCGLRAVDRARADRAVLSEISRLLSTESNRLPERITSLLARLEEAEKARKRLNGELSQARGLALHGTTPANQSGLRIAKTRNALDDTARAEAQAFISQGKAIYLLEQEDPAAILLACSTDSGIHAGNLLKDLLVRLGGRGGGSQTVAQGSLPAGMSGKAIEEIENTLTRK